MQLKCLSYLSHLQYFKHSSFFSRTTCFSKQLQKGGGFRKYVGRYMSYSWFGAANGTEITHLIFNIGSNWQKAPMFAPQFSLPISTPCLSRTSVFSRPSSFWEWTDERPAENTMSYTETELTLIGQHWIICIWQCSGRGFCLTGVVCITPYYMSTPQCLELAYPAERSRERQTDRQKLCTVAIKFT